MKKNSAGRTIVLGGAWLVLLVGVMLTGYALAGSDMSRSRSSGGAGSNSAAADTCTGGACTISGAVKINANSALINHLELNNSSGTLLAFIDTDSNSFEIGVISSGIKMKLATGSVIPVQVTPGWGLGTADVMAVSATAPTITSGFGTSPSIAANGTFSFRVTIGTGGIASTGALTMPTATAAWNCMVDDQNATPLTKTKMSASSTTSVTLTNYTVATGVAAAWGAGDVVVVLCGAQ